MTFWSTRAIISDEYFILMSHESGGGGGSETFIYTELQKASEGVLGFIANLMRAFVNTILGTGHH